MFSLFQRYNCGGVRALWNIFTSNNKPQLSEASIGEQYLSEETR